MCVSDYSTYPCTSSNFEYIMSDSNSCKDIRLLATYIILTWQCVISTLMCPHAASYPSLAQLRQVACLAGHHRVTLFLTCVHYICGFAVSSSSALFVTSLRLWHTDKSLSYTPVASRSGLQVLVLCSFLSFKIFAYTLASAPHPFGATWISPCPRFQRLACPTAEFALSGNILV